MADAVVYHEKQEAALCGCHALNNLVQSRAFDEFQLADIARELDDAERTLMLANGIDSEDALKYIAEGSGNVDDSGNFSITVLREALSRSYGIELSSEDSDVQRALFDPAGAFDAYLLNLREHWFAIRKLHGVWLNLNSLNTLPQVIGELYLSAYLAQMKNEGYFIFCVKGAMPAPDLSSAQATNLHRLADVKASRATRAADDARKAAKLQATATAEDDPEFAAALAASLADSGASYRGGAGGRGTGAGGADFVELDGDDEEAQLRAALAASLADAGPSSSAGGPASSSAAAAPGGSFAGAGAGHRLGGGPGASASATSGSLKRPASYMSADDGPTAAAAGADDDHDDEELRRALAMSLQDGNSAAGGVGGAGQPIKSPRGASDGAGGSASTPVQPVETAGAAAGRLLSSIPPEPSATDAGTARLQLRLPAAPPLPAGVSASASTLARYGLKGGSTGPAGVPSSSAPPAVPPGQRELTVVRRFRREEPLAHVLTWVQAAWLKAYAAGDAEPAGATAAGTTEAPQAFSVPAFGLTVAGVVPRTLQAEPQPQAGGDTEATATVESSGLAPSASLTLRPA